MRDLAERALKACQKSGASYADVRIVTIVDERIFVKNGKTDVMSISQTKGFGIRAITNGGLGFAGSYDLSMDEIERVAKLAVRIAEASGSTRKEPIVFVDEKPVEDSYRSHFKKDPFQVSLEEKLEILTEAEKRLREYSPEVIKMSESNYRGHREDKILVTSEGADIEQQILWCGGGMHCVAVTPGSSPQRRSYPNSFWGDFATRGFEHFEEMKLLENTELTARQAIDVTTAKQCPTDKTTLILSDHS